MKQWRHSECLRKYTFDLHDGLLYGKQQTSRRVISWLFDYWRTFSGKKGRSISLASRSDSTSGLPLLAAFYKVEYSMLRVLTCINRSLGRVSMKNLVWLVLLRWVYSGSYGSIRDYYFMLRHVLTYLRISHNTRRYNWRKRKTDYNRYYLLKQRLRQYYGGVGNRYLRQSILGQQESSYGIIKKLELNTSMLVYRIGLVETVRAARNVVRGYGVYVNDRLVRSVDYRIRVKDIVRLPYSLWLVGMSRLNIGEYAKWCRKLREENSVEIRRGVKGMYLHLIFLKTKTQPTPTYKRPTRLDFGSLKRLRDRSR